MIRLRNDLFAAILFATGSLGFPGALAAQAPDASAGSKIAATDADAQSNEKEVLRTVLQTRDEVRALRREVDSLRKALESARGESESNRPLVEKFYAKDTRGIHPALTDGVYFFSAPWCGPCKMMQPIIERLQREGLPIRTVNVDKKRRNGFAIETIPTFVLLLDHHEKERKKGVLTEAELRAFLAKVPKDGATSATSTNWQPAPSDAKTESHTAAASESAAQPSTKAPHDPPTGSSVATPPTFQAAQKVVWRYFAGNKSVSGERLAMELKSKPAYASILGKFDPENLAQDVAAVRKYYETLGFFDAKMTPTIEYSKDRKWLYVCYTVEEGPQYRIRKINLIGNTHFKAEELLAAIKTREGEVYNALAIKEDIEAIRKKYALSQFMAMTAEVVPQQLGQPGSIDLVVRINEGKPHDVRAYPVADLVLPLPGGPTTNVQNNFEKLIGLVTDTIEPKTWQKAGGGGSITHYDKTLSLIVRQTPAVQRRISALLRSLRSLQDWQVCLELSFLKNPPADLLQGLGLSAPPEGSQGVIPLTDEQRKTLLAAVGQNPNSKVLAVNATMFYGTHGVIGFAQLENQTINVGIADSTDRYAVGLHLELHDNKTKKAAAEPVTVTIPNLKTVVIEFKPIGEGASARPSLLVVRPRLLFPMEEEEIRQ